MPVTDDLDTQINMTSSTNNVATGKAFNEQELTAQLDALLRMRDSEYAMFTAIASGMTRELFYDRLVAHVATIMPEVRCCLVSCDSELTDWRILNQQGWERVGADKVGVLERVPQAMITFAASPSRDTCQHRDLSTHSDWIAWYGLLDDQGLAQCDMLSVQDELGGWFLVALFSQTLSAVERQSFNWHVEQALKGLKTLTQAYFCHNEADRVLIESQKSDKITGLLLRHAFDDLFAVMLKDARRYFQRLAMVSVQVTGLQHSDDIKQFSQVLAKTLRDNDLIARYGDNEFLMAMRIGQLDDVEVVAKKLMRSLDEAELMQQRPGCEVKVGLALYPEQSNNASLYHSAHNAAKAVAEPVGYRLEYYGNFVQSLDEAYSL
jgi:GGDEF domain-containing protein